LVIFPLFAPFVFPSPLTLLSSSTFFFYFHSSYQTTFSPPAYDLTFRLSAGLPFEHKQDSHSINHLSRSNHNNNHNKKGHHTQHTDTLNTMARFRMRLAIVIAITLAACLAISTRHIVDAVALAQPGEDIDRVSSSIIFFLFFIPF
jgi:hypothetical protein